MTNQMILTRIVADERLALRFDNALRGVADNMTAQLHNMNAGLTRLTWYSSCVTKNYQDVCSRLKNEDVRFGLAIGEIFKRRDIVYDMIKIYVDKRLSGFTESDLKAVAAGISKIGSRFASNQSLSISLGITISKAISQNFHVVNNFIGKTSAAASFVLSGYGIVQEASDAAARLKNDNRFYYDL